MRLLFVLILLVGVFLGASSSAEIFRYTDASGEVHYTNDLSSVPVDRLDQVTRTEETRSSPESQSPSKSSSAIVYPLLERQPSNEMVMGAQQRLQKRQLLESEYQSLLKEKEALDNDESFQKRRTKSKYKNRPYILELVARETQLKQRLAEIEIQLANLPNE